MHESRKDVHSLVTAANREASLELSGRGVGVSLVEMLLPKCDPQEKSSMRETKLGARRTAAPCSSVIIVSVAIPLNLLTEASSVAVAQKRHISIRDWHRLAPVYRSRPIFIATLNELWKHKTRQLNGARIYWPICPTSIKTARKIIDHASGTAAS